MANELNFLHNCEEIIDKNLKEAKGLLKTRKKSMCWPPNKSEESSPMPHWVFILTLPNEAYESKN